VKRRFRLTRSTDFKRVRRYGKSYAHPLIVLIRHPNELPASRIAVAAGRSIGNAIHRNRVKRQIRETIRPILPAITPGWDIIILARPPIKQASFSKILSAVHQMMEQADLLEDLNVN
jgi:ribonuclease P protein component